MQFQSGKHSTVIDNIGFWIDVAFPVTNVQRCFAKLCIFTAAREPRYSKVLFESSSLNTLLCSSVSIEKKIIFSDYQNIRCLSFSSPSLNMMIQKISLGIFKIISLEIFNSFTSSTVDIAKSRIKNQDLEGVKSGHRIVRSRFAPSSNGAMLILKSITIPYYKIQLPRIESLLSPFRLKKRSRKNKSFFLG